MPFGEIFTGAFQRIWRHKNLWLLAMIGLALSGIGALVSALLTARWLNGYMGLMAGMFRNPGAMPGRAFGDMMNSMAPLWTVSICAGLLGLIGYVVNLVARGGIIGEAAHAWRGEATDTSRGLRTGAQRAVYVFLLDLMWVLPALLVGIAGFVAFFGVTAVTISASQQRSGDGIIPVVWLAFACCGGCLALLYYLVFSIFSPLMYQSAVAGRRDIGGAVSEGWRLAQRNLGGMIIFWLLLLLVGFVLGALVQAVNALFSLPLMTSWISGMTGMMQGYGGGFVPMMRTSGPLLVIAGLVSAVLAFLINTFTQTLNLTVYSGAYQHLTGLGLAAPAEPSPAPYVPAADVLAAPAADVLDPPAADVLDPPAAEAADAPAELIVPPAGEPEEAPPPTL